MVGKGRGIPPSYYPHLHPRDGPRLHHLFPVKAGDLATEKGPWISRFSLAKHALLRG